MDSIQHYFICRPSDQLRRNMDAEFEPRAIAMLALAARRSSRKTRSHPHWSISHLQGNLHKRIFVIETYPEK